MEYKFEDGYKDLRKLSRKELDDARKKIQIVFQDPYSSLNPAFTIIGSLEDPLIKFGVKTKAERIEKIGKLKVQKSLTDGDTVYVEVVDSNKKVFFELKIEPTVQLVVYTQRKK